MLRIAHIIGGLNVGGAEKMLQRLATEHNKDPDVSILVISMTDIGAPGKHLQDHGIRVEALNMMGFLSAISGFIKMLYLLLKFKPDVVQTWLYWADLTGGLAAKLCGTKVIIWNIRCTQFGDGRWTGYLVRLNARLSQWLPTSIICCGHTAKLFHKAQGFESAKMVVLPNGYDVDYFSRTDQAQRRPANLEKLHVVAIGRMDALKDYPVLIAAARIALDRRNLHFSIFGRGCEGHIPTEKLICDLDMVENFSLFDEVSDVRIPLSQADIFVSSSVSEGFPNVVVEAMAMQVPCVVTDAGDAALIVGDTGRVVHISDPTELAAGIIEISSLSHAERTALGLSARERIVSNYEIAHVAQMYLDHYRKSVNRWKQCIA